ncbi:MAG: hypothetical protein V9H69_19410 [Anaerolineae bacterium]
MAIPYNSPHKAAAMVTADFLLSPEAQLSKADPARLGRPAGDRPGAAAGRVAAALRRAAARPGHACPTPN